MDELRGKGEIQKMKTINYRYTVVLNSLRESFRCLLHLVLVILIVFAP